MKSRTGIALFVLISWQALAQDQTFSVSLPMIRLDMSEKNVFQALGGITPSSPKAEFGRVTMIQTGNGGSGILTRDGRDASLSVSHTSHDGTIYMRDGLVRSLERTWGRWDYAPDVPDIGVKGKPAVSFAQALFDMLSTTIGDKPTTAIVRAFRTVGAETKSECVEILRGNHWSGFCVNRMQTTSPDEWVYIQEEVHR